MKKLIFVALVLVAGIALGIYIQKQPKAETVETQMQTDVNGGVKTADTVAAEVKAGVQKAGDVATNVAGQVKADTQKVIEFTTNAAGEIKQKLN